LHVPAGAAETVVDIEMPECGIDIVAPKPVNGVAPEANTFGIAGRSAERLGSLFEFIHLLLCFFGLVAGFRLLLVRGLGIAALGEDRLRNENGCAKRGSHETRNTENHRL
jgi:hypothetical protein